MGNVSVMWLEYNCKEQYKISDWVFGCMGSLSEKKNNDTYLHIEERGIWILCEFWTQTEKYYTTKHTTIAESLL